MAMDSMKQAKDVMMIAKENLPMEIVIKTPKKASLPIFAFVNRIYATKMESMESIKFCHPCLCF